MKKYIAIVPAVLGLMLAFSISMPSSVAHAQNTGVCFAVSSSPFDINSGAAQTVLTQGSGSCSNSTTWNVYINTSSGEVPLAAPSTPMPGYDTLSYNEVVSSSDYSLSLGLPGSGGGQTSFGYLTLTPPFKFNTTDPTLAATYTQEVINSITSNGTISVQVGPFTATIPAVVPPATVTTSNAPSNLNATMSTTNIGQINLTWTAGGPTPLAGYAIQRSFEGMSGTFTTIGTTSPSVTSYTDDLTHSAIGGPSETYRVRAVSTSGNFSSYTNIATVSNCVSLGGSGSRKIVFMRGGSNWDYSGATVNYFIGQFNNVINYGFKSIDPYKSYSNQFSFYFDLVTYNSGGEINISNPTTGDSFIRTGDGVTSASITINSSLSSCSSSQADTYIYFENTDSIGDPAYAVVGAGLAVYNLSVADSLDILGELENASGMDAAHALATVIVHETSHAFAGLLDEYLNSNQAGDILQIGSSNPRLLTTENCDSNPSWGFRSPYDNHVYGSVTDTGCEFLLQNLKSGQKHPDNYYRPSSNSIMKSGDVFAGYEKVFLPEFNVISCGYIIAAIDGQALSKANAALHWPECLAMAKAGTVVSDDMPSVVSAPTIGSIAPAAGASSANTFTVSGSGLTSTDNAIMLTPVSQTSLAPSSIFQANVYSAFEAVWNFFKNLIPKAHGQTTSTGGFYDIPGISSTDGSSLIFSVPTTTPDGTYKVSVGAFNSPWTNTTYTITVTGNGAGDPTTEVGYTGTTSGPSLTISATMTYTCPPQTVDNSTYTFPISGNTCVSFVPSLIQSFPASVLGYTCPDNSTILSGTSCIPINGGVSTATTTPASVAYTCPSHTANGITTYYVLSSNNTCDFGSPQYLAQILGYVCANSQYTLSGTSCILNAVTTSTVTPATTVYACPQKTIDNSTYYLIPSSDNTCNSKNGLPPQYLAQVIGYTCANSQYTASGKSCVLNAVTTATVTPSTTVYSCPQNPTIEGVTFNYTLNSQNACSSNFGNVFPTITHTCPTGYTLSGTACNLILIAPKSLTSSASTQGQVSLSWSNNSATGMTGVDVERSTSKSSGYSSIIVTSPTATTYIDTSVLPLTTYYYNVRLQYGSSYGPYAATTTVTTLKSTTYIITSSAGAGGSIFPSSASTVNSGSSQIFTITPNSGYQVSSVTVDSSAVSVPSSGGSYAFSNVTASHTINASFTAIPASVQTPAPIPATLIYSCPSGSTLNSSNNTCNGTTNTAATATYSCPSGATLSGSTCSTTSASVSTVVATATYSCLSGSTLDSSGTNCTTTSTSPATASYSCPPGYQGLNASTNVCSLPISQTRPTPAVGGSCRSGYILSGNMCYRDTGQPLTVPAVASYSCPTGSTLDSSGSNCTTTSSAPATSAYSCPSGDTLTSSNQCSVPATTTTAPATVSYSCPTGSTLNSANNTCSSTSASTPATATYSCPSGYILNSSNNTCSAQTSMQSTTSSSTASVWNAIVGWFQGLFR